MCDYVLYKMLPRSGLLSLLVVVSLSVSAENRSPWSTDPGYASQGYESSSSSEIDSPWFISDEQKQASRFWTQPVKPEYQYHENRYPKDNNRFVNESEPYYREPGYAVQPDLEPYRRAVDEPTWGQLSSEKEKRDRYVTPEIIQSLNRQEAQYYSQLNRNRQQAYAPIYQESPYRQYAQEYPAAPTYGMGSLNPAYDVPAVSPWGNTPDILNSRDNFPWMPNEAVGGVPPIHVPPFVGNEEFGRENRSTGNIENKVFNPFTFLEGGK